MNKDIAEQWATRLETGGLTQGKGYLIRIHPDGTRSYCCLGVLCAMAAEAGIVREAGTISVGTIPDDDSDDQAVRFADVDTDGYETGTESRLLPDQVRVWAGLNCNNPAVPNPHVLHASDSRNGLKVLSLAELNDSGQDFGAIAGWIRAHFIEGDSGDDSGDDGI